jgi:hypothetical protein
VSRARGRPPAVEPAEVEYDITVVDGAAGKRLAAIQAQAILDVLLWWRDHTNTSPPDGEPASPDGGSPGR